MVRPALLIAADANLPWQVKRTQRREPQSRMRGLPVMVRPVLLIAGRREPQPGVFLSRRHNPECEARR